MVLLVFILLVDSSSVGYPDIMLNDCTPSLVHILFSSILLMPSVLVPDSGPPLLVVKICAYNIKILFGNNSLVILWNRQAAWPNSIHCQLEVTCHLPFRVMSPGFHLGCSLLKTWKNAQEVMIFEGSWEFRNVSPSFSWQQDYYTVSSHYS